MAVALGVLAALAVLAVIVSMMRGDEPSRVIVCGGRHYGETPEQREVIRCAIVELGPGPWVVVHGAQRGADAYAATMAEQMGHATEPHPANVALYGSPAAFHIRNEEIIYGGAALVIAFPGGRGTASLLRLAGRAGIPVCERPEAPWRGCDWP